LKAQELYIDLEFKSEIHLKEVFVLEE
jgi:hypothetical protein